MADVHLCCTGLGSSPPPPKDGAEYKALLAHLKTMLAHFAFSGPDRKLYAPIPPGSRSGERKREREREAHTRQ